MRALLNNPWFVGVFAAVALLYLGNQLWQPWAAEDARNGLNTAEVPSLAELDDQPRLPGGSRPTFAGRTQRQDIRWLEDIERDPFGEYLNLDGEDLQSQPGTQVTSDGPRLPKLEALFFGRDVKAAVLNSRLRGVGAFIDEFEILSVEPNAVTLGYEGKAYRLEPDAS